ncbi:MAG: hypothetical protein LBK58_00740 [Prevotellaceae bacterium]|jgi:hypothetical protein|nr:hypothetical protein [Prevotellaceae bacterium]
MNMKKKIDFLKIESAFRIIFAGFFTLIALFSLWAVVVHGAWWHLPGAAISATVAWVILKKW